MKNQSRVYQIFYSKDVRKKKKVYNDGIMLFEQKKTKIYTTEGQLLVSVNNKNQPEPDEEYCINNTYVVLIDKEVPLQTFVSGKIFMQNKLPAPLIVQSVNKKKKAKQSLIKLQIQIAKQFQNGLKIEKFLYDKLRPHQIQGVNFMYECITGQRGTQIEGCILADFMGLGKTLQTLALIRSVIIQKIASKIVVVCPLTLLRIWQKQCLKWMGNKLSPLIALGTSEQITKIIRMFTDYDYRFLVVSYQNFLKNADALNKKCEMLIFDEGHRLKNKKSKLFKKIQTFKCRKRILLTGTPLQNNLDQLYTCITLVNPFFFQSQTVFKNVFQKPILAGMAKAASKQQRVLAVSRTLELASRIKQFSLRRKAEVLQKYLPVKRQYQIFFKVTALQQKIYQRIMRKKLNDVEVLSFLNLMRKLFTHPLLFKHDRFQNDQLRECFQDCREEMSYKVEFIKQIAKGCVQSKQKLIIVSYFTQTLDFIAEILKQEDISLAKLDGRVDGQERYKIIENFIREKHVLLLSGKAGGTGLTLICACKMIMVQPDWNPSNDSQVMGRVWRQGQQNQVQIYRLIISSSFQEKILQRQQLKQSLSQKLIDDQNNTNSYDFFKLKQLFVQITDRCLTYAQSENKLEWCRKTKEGVDWRNVTHVHIKQSHQQHSKIDNEFQQAVFEENSEKSQGEAEEDNFYERDQRYQYDQQQKKNSINAKGLYQFTEDQFSQNFLNQVNILKKDIAQSTYQTKKQKIQVPLENTLPNILRKFKKNLIKIEPSEQDQK